MVKWNSSPHPISDIRDWSELKRLELQPDFQRREVWSDSARVMLMDTILRDIPMPKVFVASQIRGKNTHRIVIDGQQRLSAILAFMRDEFPLKPPYAGPAAGKVFSELGEEETDQFLSYPIDFNEAKNPTDEEVREVYARVNKYTVPLTRQELRRADYPGDFLDVSEALAVDPFFDDAKIFTPAQRRRYADVEFTSEILAAMLEGIQDKKGDLDALYQSHAKWEKASRRKTEEEFASVLATIRLLFTTLPIESSRFRQKSDFYSLFGVILDLLREGGTLDGKDLRPLQQDLHLLNAYIEPQSHVGLLSEYAIKCVSQANTVGSRRWRHDFLKVFLRGTFHSKLPEPQGAEIFASISYDLLNDGGFCPPSEIPCPVCEELVDHDLSDVFLAWSRGVNVYQLENSELIHIVPCGEAATAFNLVRIPKTADDRQQDLL